MLCFYPSHPDDILAGHTLSASVYRWSGKFWESGSKAILKSRKADE